MEIGGEMLPTSHISPLSSAVPRFPDNRTNVPRVRGGVRRRWRVNAIVTLSP